MPKKLPSTAKQRRNWFLHVFIFLVVNAVLWYIAYAGTELEPFVYPWPIWITAAWFLTIVSHACLIWYNYQDDNFDTFQKQAKEG